MMAQYLEIKAAHPGCLLFYRMGDFYELFFEDAEIASSALGIVLTKRGKHLGEDIRMCGVPIDRSDDYLQRLIALGHRVAVCEQTEDPAEAKKRGGKSVVQRAVVRLVTPGTITEDRLLDPSRANVLLALARVRLSDDSQRCGLACVDISTGAFGVSEAPSESLAAEIARIEPREIVVPEAMHEEVRDLLAGTGVAITPMGRDMADGFSAERRLATFYGVETLDGFGSFSRAEIAAAAVAVAYVERTQLAARPNLAAPTRAVRGHLVEIDAATRANLELTRTLSGERTGSLLAAIDMTVTPAGSRLLAERLAGPLTDPELIHRRLDAAGFLVAEPLLRLEMRRVLKGAPDMARAIARLALQRGGPRDLASLAQGLAVAEALAGLLRRHELPTDLARAAGAIAGADPALHLRLAGALADDLPLNKRDGGFVRPDFEPALDEARALRDESRKVIASLQARYAELAETRQLKIKHNNFLGFFIEVPQAQGERLVRPPFNASFVHRQTMADAMRFSTAELAELESKIASAADRALTLELDVFERLAGEVLAAGDAIKAVCEGLAEVDVTAAIAELAATRDWTRPEVDRSLAFIVEGGRHPVVEASLKLRGEGFVANSCDLSGDADGGRIAVVTGPNMAGKSTFLRQNALIAVLAQMGAYVPAARVRLGVIDRLFSRVGAADDLARGRSTFMVEMVETAAILNQATMRSLVILDEIGRGTATFDGLSIAWAAMEHLHDHNRARALFATHFHELTLLTKTLKRLHNLTMRITDWNGEVIFLHEVIAGAADRSYGIQVAKLAGLPAAVVERARLLLAEFEASDRQAHVHRLIGDLPLFAAPVRMASPPPPTVPKRDPLREALDAIDPDEMTPRAAIEALYGLKRARNAEAKK
jgi:DNA mismatch repair protein MutS